MRELTHDETLKEWICPIDKLPVIATFSDVFYQREMKNFECRCLFNENGCTWKGLLSDLQDHEQGCHYIKVASPKCGVATSKINLEIHQSNDCVHRIEPCTHCSQPVAVDKSRDHASQCKELPVECPLACGTPGLLRRSLDDHLLTHCTNNASHGCQFESSGCDFRGTWKDQEKHRLESVDFHMLLLAQNDRQRQATVSRLVDENQRLWHALEEIQENMKMLTTSVSEIEKTNKESETGRTDALASQVEEVIETIRSQANLIGQLEESLSNATPYDTRQLCDKNKSLVDVEHRLWLLENGSTSGSYLWRIDDFPRHLHDAKLKEKVSFVSAPFRVGRFGYKLCLMVFPDGFGSGRGTHLSVCVQILRGEFDQVLPWPFRKKIEVRLLNQYKRGDVMQTIVPTAQDPSFQKPTTEGWNPGCGFPNFCLLSNVTRAGGGFMDKGTMYLFVFLTDVPEGVYETSSSSVDRQLLS